MEMGVALTSLSGGFFGGWLIGYALKKIIKLISIVIGLFFAALTYLQYQQIVNVDWSRLETVSELTAQTVMNSTDNGIPGIVSSQIFESWGIPLTGGMTFGFAMGFMKA